MTIDSDAPIDLSSLDPTRDAARMDAFARAVGERAELMLAARRRVASRPPSVFAEMARWSRPVLAAASLLVVGSGGLLVLERRAAVSEEVPLALASALPSGVSSAMVAGEAPAPAALLFQTARDAR